MREIPREGGWQPMRADIPHEGAPAICEHDGREYCTACGTRLSWVWSGRYDGKTGQRELKAGCARCLHPGLWRRLKPFLTWLMLVAMAVGFHVVACSRGAYA